VLSDSSRNLPHLTVACIVQQDEQFLLVEEQKFGKAVFNQPAGHVENNETLTQACVRETLEETGYLIEPTALLGFYRYFAKANHTHYMRCSIIAQVIKKQTDVLDPDITAYHWFSLEQIKHLNKQQLLRSPLVLQNIEDFLSGQSFDIKAINE